MTRPKEDRGSALIEAALVAPLLILILFSLIEIGFAWRADNELARSVRGALLEEARGSDERFNDLRSLEVLRSTIGKHETLEWVIVYATDSSNPGPPVACVSLAQTLSSSYDGITDTCNVYSGTFAATAAESQFDDPLCLSNPDEDFCPIGRAALIGTTGRIGVAVQVEHNWITGFLGGTGITLEDFAVSPLISGIGDIE